MTSTVAVRAAGPADGCAVRRLLTGAGLPLDGVDDLWRSWVTTADDVTIVGTAGLERHGDALLLRSVAVDPGARGRRLGARLVTVSLEAGVGIGPVALLTTTAADWFLRFGFVVVPRERLHPALAASAEVRGACPANATAMVHP